MSGEGAKPEAAVLPIRRASLSQKDVRQPVRHQVPATGNLSRPKVVPRPGSRVASIAKSFEQLSLAEGRTVTNRRSFRAASGIIRPSTVRRTHSVLTQQKPLTAVQVAVRNLEARCASPAKETPANHSFLWTRDNKELPYGGSLSSASGDASKRWTTAAHRRQRMSTCMSPSTMSLIINRREMKKHVPAVTSGWRSHHIARPSDGRLLEEEPFYQFYQQAVVQQACRWGSIDADEPCGQRTLWRELPQVRASGVLERLTDTERRQQEALFEVLTSEASYQRSLHLLSDHFAQGLQGTIEPREWDALFGSLAPLREASKQLLARLNQAWDGPLLCEREVCNALQEHASQYGASYVRYCSHQGHQERLLRELTASRPDVAAQLRDLEVAPNCQGLRLHSFLLLPMQRVTRLPLLADALLKHVPDSTPARDAIGALNQVVAECNEGARKMARMEEMLHISRTLEFRDCRAVPLISSSRWLVKRGPLVRVSLDSRRRTWGRLVQCARTSLHLFLFTDLLLVTKRKGEDYYAVLDHCPRNMVQACAEATLPSRLPDCCRHLFQLTLLQNSAGRTVEMLLAAESESDKTRWMDVLTPIISNDPDERIYEEWDCPQVQCLHAYTPQQADELALEEADVVNVFRKMSDGWYEGERLRDGARGWFPASHTVELVNLHVRSRNLRLRYRLLMASQTLLEKQQLNKSDA
ncbi:ephexin isoform X4 [Rhipicephalus microplus]|uniref:ephexin isoform X4 n=1 Tax=Rhipicephalus microplus TaxID=6941 RepID=UPI003F6B646E